MSLQVSILSLAKNNNGFFKSEKQASFIISQLDQNEDCFGHVSSGYNSCPLFAEYDAKGITRIYKQTVRGSVTTFERAVEGKLNSVQQKEVNSLKRRLNKLKKDLDRKVNSFESGNYNSSGDKSTYDDYMIELYNKTTDRLRESINSLKIKINSY